MGDFGENVDFDRNLHPSPRDPVVTRLQDPAVVRPVITTVDRYRERIFGAGWYKALVLTVERRALTGRNDTAHDLDHALVVVGNAIDLAARIHDKKPGEEPPNLEVIAAAALCHDLVANPKNSAAAKEDHLNSARLAREFLHELSEAHDFLREDADFVFEIILHCSYTAGTPPSSLEEKIVRDADLLERVGARGVARFFATGQMLGRRFINLRDPRAQERELDPWLVTMDAIERYAIGVVPHFFTEEARKIARDRSKVSRDFLSALVTESATARLARGL